MLALFRKDAPPTLSAVVRKYADVFAGRIEYRCPLRDGPPGLLRANGFLSVFMKCCTKDGLRQRGTVDVPG